MINLDTSEEKRSTNVEKTKLEILLKSDPSERFLNFEKHKLMLLLLQTVKKDILRKDAEYVM